MEVFKKIENFFLFSGTLLLFYTLQVATADESATVTLAAMFPINSYGKTVHDCHQFEPLYALEVEGILWAINNANKRFKKLGFTNFTMGATVKDTCDNRVIGAQQSLNFIKTEMKTGGICKPIRLNVGESPIVGMLGPITTAVSKAVTSLMEMYCVSQIGFSTGSMLSDTIMYPYFMRTVPDDFYQSLALLELLKTSTGAQVSIVYEHTSYGDNLDAQLLRHIDSYNNKSGSILDDEGNIHMRRLFINYC